MPKLMLFLSAALTITTISPAGAEISNQRRSIQPRTFQCVTRGSSVTVTLQPNQRYSATRNSQTLMSGQHLTVGLADRLKTGGLKGQSIVKQKGGIYLVDTKSEAKAAELAAVDAALSCTQQ